MGLFNNLTERLLQELNYGGFMRKQQSINKLFPKFRDRVQAVDKNGGIQLVAKTPDLWKFKVASGTEPGLSYTVYLKFKNVEEAIRKFVPNKVLWKNDQSGVSYQLLAAEILNWVDLESDCNCPADLYWGPEYIKTQYKHKKGGIAQYDHEENRPPRKRNPKQYGALCKHGFDVFQRLPFYVSTFSSFLKEYYATIIDDVFNEVKSKTNKFKVSPTVSKGPKTSPKDMAPRSSTKSSSVEPGEVKPEEVGAEGETKTEEPTTEKPEEKIPGEEEKAMKSATTRITGPEDKNKKSKLKPKG